MSTSGGLVSLAVAVCALVGPMSAPSSAATRPLTAASAVVATCGPAYPPNHPTVTVSTSTVHPGGKVTVDITGWAPGTKVAINLDPGGQVLVTLTVPHDGSATVTVTIPSSDPPGTYHVAVSGQGCSGKPVTIQSGITVTASVTPPTTTVPTLPFTGSNVALPVGLGVALLVIGLFAVVFARRRPRTVGHE